MNDCVFCKIVSGQIPAVKIWENEQFLAILDAFPNTKGMSLVLPKTHYDSDIFKMNTSVYQQLTAAARTVVELLERGLGVERVAMVAEGMGVNHAHIKLYPLHGLGEKFKVIWAKEKVYFEKYQGYLSTQLGPQDDIEELKKLAAQIKT